MPICAAAPRSTVVLGDEIEAFEGTSMRIAVRPFVCGISTLRFLSSCTASCWLSVAEYSAIGTATHPGYRFRHLMPGLLPVAAVMPVHGVVQLASNVTRTVLGARHVQ